jgi:hypothetical protein
MGLLDLLVKLLAGKEVLDIVTTEKPMPKSTLDTISKGIENLVQFVVGSWFLCIFIGIIIGFIAMQFLALDVYGQALAAFVPLALAIWFFDMARR